MLSPKIQRSIRINEGQLIALSERAQFDHAQEATLSSLKNKVGAKVHKRAGFLSKKSSDGNRWQQRWCILYQNLLFYYESDNITRPIGVVLLEGSYCERVVGMPTEREPTFGFMIVYRRENLRQYEFRAASEAECSLWIDAIQEASFNKMLMQKEALEQQNRHLIQVMESERTSRWEFMVDRDNLNFEVKKLKSEVLTLNVAARWKYAAQVEQLCKTVEKLKSELITYRKEAGKPVEDLENSDKLEPAELRQIKKVQSFFRGWLCRRRWKQIVDMYIKSPFAESMRKRNSLVFKMVEAEEEYLEQLEILVSCFYRPFKMAASSKKPPCTHEDVNSIFLNVETVLFLHQIFYKGLTARMDSWPTLVLSDLFDMLVPMLTIYQEYVRNHHYSLQVLTECKQKPAFTQLVARLEEKPACQDRTLETFLTYPMHQIPRYIITLHELLAHTPVDHVERRSLLHARQQLEDLSRQMHDEVSETESLRKNLALERMIIEGCDILLDVNQVFIRQGMLSQVRLKGRKTTLQSRQAFLFSNYLLLTTRASAGRLHLKPEDRLPLHDALLIEDPGSYEDFGSDIYMGRDFKILVEVKGQQICAHLVASTTEIKAAWTSELANCMESAALTEMMRACANSNASASLPACRTDRALFTDDVDIRFSRTLNSCKVPQIRSATPQRLLQRLTDLRFLSVDFLNTFLLTYRVFTDGVTVLEALKQVFYEQSTQDLDPPPPVDPNRKTSAASSVSGYGSEYSDRDWQTRFWKPVKKLEEEDKLCPNLVAPPSRRLSAISVTKKIALDLAKNLETACAVLKLTNNTSTKTEEDTNHLTIPKIMATSSSNETLKGDAPSSPGAVSSVTLVGSSKDDQKAEKEKKEVESSTSKVEDKPPIKPRNGGKFKKEESIEMVDQTVESNNNMRIKEEEPDKSKSKVEDSKFKISQRFSEYSTQCEQRARTLSESPRRQQLSAAAAADRRRSDSVRGAPPAPDDARRASDTAARYGPRRSVSERRYTNSSINSERRRYYGGSEPRSSVASQISGQNYRRDFTQPKVGVVITSFRQSHRRSSTSTAAIAFAVATSGASNPRSPPTSPPAAPRRDSVISTAATMRVLNVLRHWISKHSHDFWVDEELRIMTMEFIKEIQNSPALLPAEHKAATQLLRHLESVPETKVDLQALLASPSVPAEHNSATLLALDLAEQLTYLDYQIFRNINSEELLGQAWTKADKAERAPHVLLMTSHFNHICNLIISEILQKETMQERVAAIEKWAAAGDIIRCMHNFNGVLQIYAALSNTSIFRLKKTWEKVSSHSKSVVEKLQAVATSEGRFRVMRDELHRSDPPCIPYLGMYLSDLSFIEEGTPNYTTDGLLNFSKMRMIAHVIREIRNYQQVPFKINYNKPICDFLLDRSIVLDEEQQYELSLRIEPRCPRGSISAGVAGTETVGRTGAEGAVSSSIGGIGACSPASS